uniref:Centrosome-associated FAM110 C-terminal domain-containing protein n=1 Tax=Eptatretus burgeri TaxID=7764 RepID=A0A8C4Q4X3_EPTBU
MPAGAGLETGLRSPAMTQAAQLPLRLLSKGPDYLRLHVGCERRDCLSVRERLEADRAKYVKSPSPMPSSKMATVHHSPSPTPISEQKTCCDGNLNLEALNNAINSLQQPAKSGAGWNRQAHPLALRPKPVMYTNQRLSPNSSPSSGPSFHPFCSTQVSFNGRPSSTLGFEYQFGLDSFMCSHSAYGGDKPSTSIVAAKGSTSDLVTGNSSTSENPHDSSGLAMVVSNDADEQQRFFEFCGLEPAFLKSVTATKRASQILEHSVCSDDPALDGLSTRSRWGNADLDADGLEHAPSLVSVVERNARIIKWLYACQKVCHIVSFGNAFL